MEVYPEGQINKIGKTAMKILGIKVYQIRKGDGTSVHKRRRDISDRNIF